MKILTLAFALFLASGAVTHAAVITVSNHPLGGAEYSNLWEAYTDASDGDTLLLEGTNIAYSLLECNANNNIWDKPLTVIGVGFNPDKHDSKLTYIHGPGFCDERFYIGSGASGSRFYGIVFPHDVRFNTNASDILFESCRFQATLHTNCKQITNLIVRNCVINGNFTNTNTCNVVVTASLENCILDGQMAGGDNILLEVIFDHCLFLHAGDPFIDYESAQVRNSVFMHALPSGISNSAFLNNIAVVSGAFPTTNGNSSSGNLTSTEPLFVSYSGGLYTTSDDYHTQAGSPVENAATDGTDIGLHGGTTNFSEQGEVLINPIIRSMDILNTNVAPGGTLNVDLHATRPANN